MKSKYLILSNAIIISLLFSCLKDNDSYINKYSAIETLKINFLITEPNTIFDLSGISGNIIITGLSNTDSIKINAVKIAESNTKEDAEDKLDLMEIHTLQTSDTIGIWTEQPNINNGRNYIVNYFITVPDYIELQIGIVNGNIEIDTINNDIAIENVNGNIFLDEINGNTSVEITNGNIFSTVVNSAVEIELITVNGNIDLFIPQNTSAEFSSSALAGLISIYNLTILNQSTSATTKQGTLGNGDGNIELSTLNGNINVTGF